MYRIVLLAFVAGLFLFGLPAFACAGPPAVPPAVTAAPSAPVVPALPPMPAPPGGWKVIIAGLINTIGALLVVQGLKWLAPSIRRDAPLLLPLAAVAAGPLVAFVQGWLGSLLGAPIDLSPVAACFSGGTAVAVHQIYKQSDPQH